MSVILQANKFVPGPELIQMEPSEAVDKLRLAIRVLANFKQFYFEYRTKSLTEAKENPWKFQNSSLFQRLDSYLERSHDMMDMMITCTQFNKLERVEVGGTKGRVLTNGIKAIHADFTAAVERFKVRGGDPQEGCVHARRAGEITNIIHSVGFPLISYH